MEGENLQIEGFWYCLFTGTLGGAVSMNAGSRDAWIGSAIEEVTVLNPETGFKHYRYDDLYWGYRETSLPGNEIVLEARLHLAPGDKREIGARTVRLNTSVANVPANVLYAGRGFTRHRPLWLPYPGLPLPGWTNLWELAL